MIPNKYFKTLYRLTGIKAFLSPAIQREFNKNIEILPDKKNLKFILCSYYKDFSSDYISILSKHAKIQTFLSIEKYKLKKKRKNIALLYIKVDYNNLGFTPSSAKRMGKGLNIIDGLWTSLFIPNLLKKQAIDLIESKYSIECIPTIYSWKDKTFLSAVCPDVSDKMCGAPLVMKELFFDTNDFSDPDIFMLKIRSLRNTYLK